MGRRISDLTGQRFGRLTVIEFAGQGKKGASKWLCQCDCGGKKVVNRCDLQSGGTKSCGCLHQERTEQTWYKKCGKLKTLCISCIRSAAPPELQCIWDASKATVLPEGAVSEIFAINTITKKDRIRIISCPEYLSMYDVNNIALLRDARRRNDKRMSKEYADEQIM